VFEDLESVEAATLVDRLVAEQRAVAAAEARSLRITAALYRRSREWMSELAASVGVGELREITAAEIGPALTLTRFSALAMVDLAVTAEARLPLSLAALAEGRISLRKLRLIADHTDVLDDAACAAVEAQVLPRAGTQTVPLLGAALAKCGHHRRPRRRRGPPPLRPGRPAGVAAPRPRRDEPPPRGPARTPSPPLVRRPHRHRARRRQ